MALRLRQGLAADRTSITPASGELIYTTDTKLVYVGDGSTAGGNVISGSGGGGNSYSISSETATGGVNLRLTGSDSSVDNVKFAEGSNITLTRTDANTITIASSGSGSSMTFNVTGDDSSTTRSITDGETLNFIGGGSIGVSVTAGDQILISNNERVITGTASALAFYRNNTSSVEGTATASVNYNAATGKLFADRLETNVIISDQNLPIVCTDPSLPFVIMGGELDGSEYSTKLLVRSVAIDPNLQHTIFENTYDGANVNAVFHARNRGTLASPTAVQVGDTLGLICMAGNDGTAMRISSAIGTVVTSVSAGLVTSALSFGLTNSGGLTPALTIDSNKYSSFFGPALHTPQTLDFSSGDITLAYTDITSNFLIATGQTAAQQLNLPVSAEVRGLRLLIINKNPTFNINVYYSGSLLTTVAASNGKREVYYDGATWHLLY